MKKIISSVLVLCIILTTLVSAFVISANVGEEQNIITTKEIDLSLSDRLVYKNAGGDDNTAILNFKPGKVLTMKANNMAINSVAVGGTDAKEYSKQITLEYTEGEDFGGYFRIEQGKIYTVNVKYAAIPTNTSKKLSVALVAANTPDGNDATAATLAGKLFSDTTTYNSWHENQVLSAVIDSSNTYAEVGDYLRIFVGGNGSVAIESVVVQEVSAQNEDQVITVNYNDGFCTRKQFTLKDEHIVPDLYGAKQSVFGGWYTDSALTNKSNNPEANGTYYARWLSVTRELDIRNTNRMASGSNLITNTSALNFTTDTPTAPLKVVVNANNQNFRETAQQLSLEYYDLDGEAASVKDVNLNGYVAIQSNKRYAVTVDYSVTAVGDVSPKIALFAAGSSLSYENTNKTMASSTISGTGDYVLSAVVYVGLNSCAANNKLRLAFAGRGTFEIKSVTIQEVKTADIDSGDAVGIKIKENGTVYDCYAIKDNNEWVMPTPVIKGQVVSAEFDNWYSNEALTTVMSNPVAGTTYYPKWNSITRKLDLSASSRMVDTSISDYNHVYSNSANLSMTLPTKTTPLNVVVNSSNGLDKTSQHISLEYYDNEQQQAGLKDFILSGYMAIESGKLYSVSVEYSVNNIGETAPQIALVSNGTSLTSSNHQVQASATLNNEGEYVLSQIIGVGINGVAANNKLRLAFTGKGTFNVNSVTVTEFYPSSDIKPVVYKDGNNSFTALLTEEDSLLTLPARDGYTFEGWYNSSDAQITSVSQLSNTASATVLTSKWLLSSTVYDIDLTISQVIKDKDGNNNNVMLLTPDTANNDLTLDLYSGWSNIFKDEQGNLRTGTIQPDAILALKFGESTTDPAHFVKLQKDYKYVVNVEYEVITADGGYNPQIAIVKNTTQNSAQNNGTIVLNSNTHSIPGNYKLSAVLSDIDNVPLRLAFGGVGKVKITSVKVSLEQKKDNSIFAITYIDGQSNWAKFQEPGSLLDVLTDDVFDFVGWFNTNGEKQEDTEGLNSPLTLKSKWSGTQTTDVDLTISQVIKDKDGNNNNVMLLTPDTANNDLTVDLLSGWNNIFRDKEGNLRKDEIQPDAILALKLGESATDPAHFVKLQKDYDYIVNVEYEVVTADRTYNPQIAIVKNTTQNSAQNNGTIVLNSATHGSPGEYKLSAVVSDTDNIPLRLAFGGIGKVIIKKVTITAKLAEDDLLFDITYNDKETSTAYFRTENEDLQIPAKEGFVFQGWYDKEGTKVEDIKGVKESLNLYAKWTGIKSFEIDLTNSIILKDENGNQEKVMELTENLQDNSINVKLNSGWNNIFKDKNGNLRQDNLYPDAVLALKYNNADVSTSFVKFNKNYKYAINIDYEVISADANYNPQIAIIRNISSNTTQVNGSIALNSNTHSKNGEYKLSAIISGDTVENLPLRLAFGGLGEIVIKKVTMSVIHLEDENYIGLTYFDEENNFSAFQNPGSDLYTPVSNGFEFQGWYDNQNNKVENTTGITDALSVYAKWTGIISFNVDPAISQIVKNKDKNEKEIMQLTPDTQNNNLEVFFESGWNRIFRDANGNLRTKNKLWPDAIMALKRDSGTETASYLRVEDKYKYVINIDYSVTAVDNDFAPQIAIIRNVESNSMQDNGSYVLNSNTHNEKGDYSLSAYVENIDNIPIRLAFGGLGKIVIKKITVSYINAKDDSYLNVMYVDGDSNTYEFLKVGTDLSAPKDTTGFKGWYKNANCVGKTITATSTSTTVYAKRQLPAYTFDINFDTTAQTDFYKQGNHTLSDFANYGSKTEVVSSVGNNNTNAARLTYKRLSSDYSDYASNPMLALYDTNVLDGEITDKRFTGKTDKQYTVTFKYKVEETNGMSLELYFGKRNRGQSANASINEFGTDLWDINDTTKIGDTITEKTDTWKEAKVHFVANSSWFPVILLKTNNQEKSQDATAALASVLIDDIRVTEVVSLTEDTDLGVMDYENYQAITYDSASESSIIGNKYGVTVSDQENHTKNGSKSLKLTIMSDSLRYSGNTVISIDKQPIKAERNAAYIVEFWAMSPTNIDNLIWGVNSVGGSLTDITAKHKIEVRDKISLNANQWKKITAYIPKLSAFEDSIGMLSIAFAATGNDGKNIYIDDISVKFQVESQVVNFVDSDSENPVSSVSQRAFKGQKINSMPSFEKDGYLFDGWYDTAKCDGKEYKVSDIFPTDAEEITLYAKWIDESSIQAKDFTAGSFDQDIYDDGNIPYENICENSEESIYGITNVDSTQSGAWVKDSGIYGNGTAEYDGTLSLSNDTYSKFVDTNNRNAIALLNEDGTRFAVVKGEKYSIKFDYVNGSTNGTSYIQTVISKGNAYRGFGNGKDQVLKTIAVHGTDSDYQTYQEYFVADFTGFVYITFAARTDDGSPYKSLYHRIYIDNAEIKLDSEVKKVNFIAGKTVHKTIYGKLGDEFPMFDVIQGDERTTEFDGFYLEPEFKTRVEDYKFTNEEVQNLYIKYKEVKYTTPSDFTTPITLDFEETKLLNDYYRQGKHMTYWMRGEANPEWQLISNNSQNAFSGNNYMKLNGYTTYWNEAKFVLYDTNNTSGTMLLKRNATYRVKLMTRCEDKYDIPKLTITLENPSKRYLLTSEQVVTMVADETEYKNNYMCYTADITVPEKLSYLPSLAIRKNQNDLQTLFIDSVTVEEIIDCKVTFEENGGTPIDDIIVQIHEKIDDPGMPFKDGYDFVGWYYDSELTKAWDFKNMTVEKDITLYAKWVESAAISDDFAEDFTDDELGEEIETNVPNILEGDEHEYPTVSKGIATWIIVLIIVGGIIVLSGAGVLVWWLATRKKSKN